MENKGVPKGVLKSFSKGGIKGVPFITVNWGVNWVGQTSR